MHTLPLLKRYSERVNELFVQDYESQLVWWEIERSETNVFPAMVGSVHHLYSLKFDKLSLTCNH